MRFFQSKKAKRLKVLEALGPYLLFFLVGPYNGRRPLKSKRKAYLVDGIRRNLEHYGLEYDKEEAEFYAERILEKIRVIEQCQKTRATLAPSYGEEFYLSLTRDIFQESLFDKSALKQGEGGFENC